MTSRRSGLRPILLRLPTKDGHRVHVRSHTVAERLVNQQQVIEQLVGEVQEATRQLEWALERYDRLRRSLVVKLLRRVKLVREAPAARPEGWEPSAPAPPTPAKPAIGAPQ